MLSLNQLAELESARARFRELAASLKAVSPAMALQCGAMARECEVKICIAKRVSI